jgi:hypothetical protein
MTSYFAGKSEISLITVIFENGEVMCLVVFNLLRRMKRTSHLEKENSVG